MCTAHASDLRILSSNAFMAQLPAKAMQTRVASSSRANGSRRRDVFGRSELVRTQLEELGAA